MARSIRIVSLKPRSKIKDWTVEAKLGSGTYGEVWKAKHRMGSVVAIKSFARLAQIVREDKLLREILREAIAMAQIAHENVVAFNTDDIERGCIVFEFVPCSLEGEIKRRRGTPSWFSQDEALSIFKGILEGLVAIHGKNTVHGDIKPANILLTEKLTPKMSDFGMASILSAKKFPCPFFHGSNNWAAPEVLSGEKADFQSDLFSVGIIAYILFTGNHPFHRDDPTCLSGPEDYISDPGYPVQSARMLNSSIPAPISDIIDKLLQRDREKRYKNINEVLIALTELEAPTVTPTELDLTKVKVEMSKEINNSIVDAKRLFQTEFNPFGALNVLTNIINEFRSINVPFLANAFSYKAFISNYLQKWDESIEAATEGITVDPNHCDSYMARGYAYMRKGSSTGDAALMESARNDLNKAKLLAPTYTKRQQAQKYLDVLPLATPYSPSSPL
jgi:serine/threonine protein kinase